MIITTPNELWFKAVETPHKLNEAEIEMAVDAYPSVMVEHRDLLSNAQYDRAWLGYQKWVERRELGEYGALESGI